jgi:hypothetical protein
VDPATARRLGGQRLAHRRLPSTRGSRQDQNAVIGRNSSASLHLVILASHDQAAIGPAPAHAAMDPVCRCTCEDSIAFQACRAPQTALSQRQLGHKAPCAPDAPVEWIGPE